MDEQNLKGMDLPEVPEYPDMVAAPESYGESVIPDPVAAPESYGESVIPDPVAAPESYGESVIPDPVAAPESFGESVIPDPVVPQQAPVQNDQTGDNYSAHYSWNGNGYVENGTTPPPAPTYPQDGYAQQQDPFTKPQNGYHSPAYQQPVYSQNANGQMNLDPDLEKRASTVQTLGIVSLILNIIGGCGCGCLGPILSIVGLVKANGLSTVMHMMSDESQNRVKLGKTLCIVGIILSVIAFLLGFLAAFLPALIGYMEKASMY